jgi:hypothetical protein
LLQLADQLNKSGAKNEQKDGEGEKEDGDLTAEQNVMSQLLSQYALGQGAEEF